MSKTGDQAEDDQTWVLDSLVGFLKSPLWSSSLNNFIDQMSVVFEPDAIEDNEGSVDYNSEYDRIFKDYRSLVDQLITSHMSELGISEEQFARACELAEGMLAEKLKQMLFEELWAAENYEVFVRLMARRNVELQLEALDILAQKYGLVYDVFVPIDTSAREFLSEEHVMNESLLRSLEDMQLDNHADAADKSLPSNQAKSADEHKLAEAKPEVAVNDQQDPSLVTFEKDIVQLDKARLVAAKNKVDKQMREALKSAVTRKPAQDGKVEQTAEKETDEVGASQSEKEETAVASTSKPTIIEPINVETRKLTPEEVQKRAAYLREQRDKIIHARQKVRSERISKYLIKEKMSAERPKTARKQDKESTAGSSEAPDNMDLAYRKTLAARLKAEVIDRS